MCASAPCLLIRNRINFLSVTSHCWVVLTTEVRLAGSITSHIAKSFIVLGQICPVSARPEDRLATHVRLNAMSRETKYRVKRIFEACIIEVPNWQTSHFSDMGNYIVGKIVRLFSVLLITPPGVTQLHKEFSKVKISFFSYAGEFCKY